MPSITIPFSSAPEKHTSVVPAGIPTALFPPLEAGVTQQRGLYQPDLQMGCCNSLAPGRTRATPFPAASLLGFTVSTHILPEVPWALLGAREKVPRPSHHEQVSQNGRLLPPQLGAGVRLLLGTPSVTVHQCVQLSLRGPLSSAAGTD